MSHNTQPVHVALGRCVCLEDVLFFIFATSICLLKADDIFFGHLPEHGTPVFHRSLDIVREISCIRALTAVFVVPRTLGRIAKHIRGPRQGNHVNMCRWRRVAIRMEAQCESTVRWCIDWRIGWRESERSDSLEASISCNSFSTSFDLILSSSFFDTKCFVIVFACKLRAQRWFR